MSREPAALLLHKYVFSEEKMAKQQRNQPVYEEQAEPMRTPLKVLGAVACFGLAGASAVIVGKLIGEGKSQDQVYSVSWALLLLSIFVGLAVSLVLAVLLPTVFIPFLYPLFHLEGLSLRIAMTMCVIYVFFVPLKAFDITNITGILRAGGDSRMAAIMDVLPLWGVAVPFTAACGLLFDAPIPLICFAIYSESICKVPWGTWRICNRKWINDVTREAET